MAQQSSLAIYTLKRILSLGKQKSKPVHIETSTTCRTEVFSLVALYCSNGYIILRYAGPSNDTRNVLPIVRYIPWAVSDDSFESNNSKAKNVDKNKNNKNNIQNDGVIKNNKLYNHTVKYLAFNDNGKQLFVLCSDGSVYCLPALSIVMETNPSKPMMNNSKTNSNNNLIRAIPANQLLQSYARTLENGDSASDNSSIRQARHAVRDARRLVKKGSGGVSIIFWRSFQEKAYLLLGTEQGRMIIVDCGTENFGDYVLGLFIAPKHRVDKINVLTDGSKQRRWRYAIVNTSKCVKGGNEIETRIRNTYRILLERPKAFVHGLMSPYKDANKMSKNEYVNLCDHLSQAEDDNSLSSRKKSSVGGSIGFSLGGIAQRNSNSANNKTSSPNDTTNNSGTSNNNNSTLQLHPDFVPQKITFVQNYMSNNTSLSEQHLGSWQGSGLGLHDKQASVFSLFSVDAPLPQRYPLFEFQMPLSTEHILYTKRVLFVGCKNNGNSTDSHRVIKLFSSFLLSGVSASRNDSDSDNNTKSDNTGDHDSGNKTGLMQTFELPSGSDTNIINFEYAPWCFTKSEDLYLEGAIMITRDAIYEFQPRSIENIEENFQNLIDQEEADNEKLHEPNELNEKSAVLNIQKTSPEQYAQVLGLNILALYEQAGDRKLKEGNHNASRALTLYKLSNLNVHQILKRLILAGRPDLAAIHASFILSSNANNETSGFNDTEIMELSHLAIKCYLSCVERVSSKSDGSGSNNKSTNKNNSQYNRMGDNTITLQLCSDDAKIVEPNAPSGLLSFLEKNKDYDLKFVLKLLCQTGLYGAVFVASHSRKRILVALELFALSFAPKLNQLCYQYLLDHNYVKELCLASESSIFHALTADQQFQLLFKNDCTTSVNVQINLIVNLYPVLSSRIYEWNMEEILHATIVVENLLQELNNLFISSNNKTDNASRRKSLCILSECLIHFLLHYVSNSSSKNDEGRQRQLKRLEVFVSLETKYFRPSVIECLTVDFECFGVGALMYESNNRYDKAVNLRLSDIQSNYAKSNQKNKDNTFSTLLLTLVESHVLNISKSDRLIRVKALRKIFNLWFKLNFDVITLENIILKHITSLGYEFSAILFPLHNAPNNNNKVNNGIMKNNSADIRSMFASTYPNKNPLEPLYTYFSKDVCFALCIDQILPSQRENRRRRRASSMGLLGGICANLAKGVNDNREIVLHAEDVGVISDANNQVSGGDILVFSCGHNYSKQNFFENILEVFKQRLLKLRYTLPATLAVILKEYRKDNISCACPKCLIMYFEDIDLHIGQK